MTAQFSLDPQAQTLPAVRGRLTVIVTFLEMTQPPPGPKRRKPDGDIRLMRAINPTVAFYRFLYNAVGEPWLWHERRRWPAAELAKIIGDPRVEIWVLYVDGAPAGYIEIDRRGAKSDAVDLGYFGLQPEYFGRGLGPWLLGEGIAMAWQGGTGKLSVNTCTFDHPAALGLYQSFGFRPYKHVSHDIPDPRVQGWLPRDAAPHIPIIE